MKNKPFKTVTGVYLDIAHIEPEDIHFKDIAWGLSMLCRWSGQLTQFYSVAAHSVIVAKKLLHETHDPQLAWAGLMHDANEAYLVDLPRPVKELLPGYRVIEKDLQALINKKYDCGTDSPLVKEMDNRVCATEARDLVQADMDGWKDCLPPPFPEPLQLIIARSGFKAHDSVSTFWAFTDMAISLTTVLGVSIPLAEEPKVPLVAG